MFEGIRRCGQARGPLMYYVYILRLVNYLQQRYIGHTVNLKRRFAEHNSGITPHTAKYKPWIIEMYLFFSTEDRAVEFEKYLKSS